MVPVTSFMTFIGIAHVSIYEGACNQPKQRVGGSAGGTMDGCYVAESHRVKELPFGLEVRTVEKPGSMRLVGYLRKATRHQYRARQHTFQSRGRPQLANDSTVQ